MFMDLQHLILGSSNMFHRYDQVGLRPNIFYSTQNAHTHQVILAPGERNVEITMQSRAFSMEDSLDTFSRIGAKASTCRFVKDLSSESLCDLSLVDCMEAFRGVDVVGFYVFLREAGHNGCLRRGNVAFCPCGL